MEQSKIRSYLLYAFGEVALVVIGILIALQLNHWQAFKQDRIQEIFYLQKLNQNIAQDTVYLQGRIEGINISSNGLIQLSREIKDSGLKEFASDSLGVTLLGVHRFTPQTSTMDNLISTGKLDLIQNQSLVDSLFVYYNDLNNFPDQFNNSNDTYSRETIGPELLRMPGGVFHPRKSSLSESDKIFLLNAIELKLHINSRLQEEYIFSLVRAKQIMRLIESQLSGSHD